MRWSGGVNRACTIAGVIAVALLIAACGRSQPKEYGLGNTGGVAAPGSPQEFAVNVGDLVHFEEDSSALSGEAQNILRNQARWLNQYSQYTITIQGHADERGTREYNIALGARRAQNVRNYLASRGIQPNRMRTVSYGKERPVAVCNDISCWSQNRRAVTVLGATS
jgi:peptidoglycan-associated lipoprotein